MNDAIRSIRTLQIPDVKVYESVGNELSAITKGTLEVFYIPDYDRFVLKVNSFQYALSVYLPVMASLFEERCFRSYILPSVNGYYLLKFKTNPPAVLIQNFETVLAHYSQFSYKSEDKKFLESQVNAEATYLKEAGHTEQEDKTKNGQKRPSQMGLGIRKFGEILKQNAIKAAYYIDKNLNAVNKETIIVPRSIDELKTLPPNSQYIDFSGTRVSKLLTISNDIQNAQQLKHGNPQVVPTSNQVKPGQTGWNEFKQATTASAKSAWGGMNEAASILGKAFKNRKNNKANNNKDNVPKEHKSKPQDQIEDINRIPLAESTVVQRPVIDYHPEIVDLKPKQPNIHSVDLNVKEIETKEDSYFAPSEEEYHPETEQSRRYLYPRLDSVPQYNQANIIQEKTETKEYAKFI